MTRPTLKFEVIDDDMAKFWRHPSGEEYLRIANRMFLFARRTLVTSVRADHPDLDDERVNHEACRRLLRGSV